MSTPSHPKHLRIGVMLEEVQLADIIGIDIFGNLTHSYISAFADLDPRCTQWLPHSLTIEFFYIAAALDPASTTPPQAGQRSTAGFKFLPNTTYDTCPRDLDIVLIGGPLPSHRPPQADKFMKEAWGKTRVWMTTCIGSLWLASTGLLEGKKATTNKEVLHAAPGIYPGTEWLSQRWVVDEKEWDGADGRKGELWTAGGAGAGE
jgi:transcriptional regulator GlxA family with amidase domain